MREKKQLQTSVDEIEMLIRYAVPEKERAEAQALLGTYRANAVGLQVLKEYYSSLPEAREEPVLRIVHIDMRQGVFLLGLSTGQHEYIYFATEDEADCLGEYEETGGDPEILEYFGYAGKEAFLQLHPKMAEFDDFSKKWRVNKALCSVCAVAVGEYHHLGCPVEVCPWCFGQLSKCNCRFDLIQKEEMTSDEDLERFETQLQQKGRICFEEGQGPLYPALPKRR
ncbi:MAG: hypothetical protein P4L42_03295 [Desulfocapsaceae bacterium]|nr:hypothetical protein [Desulfocapsaceae bacterium]